MWLIFNSIDGYKIRINPKRLVAFHPIRYDRDFLNAENKIGSSIILDTRADFSVVETCEEISKMFDFEA